MSNRRDFIRAGLLSAGGLLAGNSWSEIPSNPDFPDKKLALEDPESYWNLIRELFPLRRDLIFLNNGTMGPSPYPILDKVNQASFINNEKASYGGWHEAVRSISDFFHADESEISLAHNVTEGINVIAQGLPLKAGEEIILSNHEHVGSALPWLNRARRSHLKIQVLDLNKSDADLLTDLERLCNSKTKVIALPHIPCTTGRILPLKEIGEIARRKGILYVVDGAHGAGLLSLDFRNMPCDFYISCCHKWMLGPKGTAFFWIRKDRLDIVEPFFVGGYSDTGWDMVPDKEPAIHGWATHANRFFYGTQNYSLYSGVIASIDFMRQCSFDLWQKRIYQLSALVDSELRKLDKVEILTPENARASMVSFRVPGKDYSKIQFQLQEDLNIIVRAVPENGVNCIRVSTHIYNTPNEIHRFVEGLSSFI